MRFIDPLGAAFAASPRARFLVSVALPPAEAALVPSGFLPGHLAVLREDPLTDTPHYHQGLHNQRKAFTAAK